ncbi:ABC transporter permease subunit [Fredinandcohnia sp. 179-A 10B2 NHS]|uniref:ABC transporter permease subunit n=1 Tax=Fredinandcohnia sp. 179-A 10B2 NHS TaxID=3235176 RepID=UPI0039A17EF3
MKLALKVGRLLLVNFLVVIGLILVTMIPRETNQVELNEFNVKYIFSIQAYFTNFLDYVKERFETLNLGETWDHTSVFQETIFYFSNSLQLMGVSLLLAFVIGIVLSFLAPKTKMPSWLKVPNFLLMIPLVYSISLIGAVKSVFFISVLISLYPSFYIASLLKEKSTLLKEKVSFIFTNLSKVILLLLSNLVLVEWLTEFTGAGYKLVTLIDFSAEPFTRANRSYEYELVISLLLCFIFMVLLAQWIEFLVKKYVKEIETHWGWYVFSHSLIILGTVILILIPRGATQDYTDIVYIFSMDTYKDNITQLVNGIIQDQTLGKTKSGFIVEEEIANYFPRSLKIILFAFIISIVIGIAKGIFDFTYQNRWFSFIGRGTTWLTSSFPDFFLIILLQWFVLVNFQSIDIMGYEEWYNFIIPSLLISIHPIMYVATITRGSFIDENGEQYVLVAYSKGLTKNKVIIRHIFKNAIPAICNHLPSVILYIMSNLLIIEWLLDYKGAAYRLFKAIEFSKSIPLQGGLATEEAPLIFGILLCFMIPLVLAQVISVVTKYKFNKVGRE